MIRTALSLLLAAVGACTAAPTTQAPLSSSRAIAPDVPPKTRHYVPRAHVSRSSQRSSAWVTMYCATGNRNAAGRWPQLGEVAVLDRRIPFGTHVRIARQTYTVADWVGWGTDYDIYGGSGGCEQRAAVFGRQRLLVVTLTPSASSTR